MKKPGKKLITVSILPLILTTGFFTGKESAYQYRSNPNNLRYYATANPHIASGMPTISAHRFGAGIEPEDDHFNLGTVRVINYANAHDIAVQYWTIDDETEADFLIKIGADTIITDYPDMVYRLCEQIIQRQ